jgi:hypothetical protein
MSRVQAAVIRAGNELEAIVETLTPANHKATLEDAIARSHSLSTVLEPSRQVVYKPRMPGTAESKGGQADVAVFDHAARTVLVIELKDGDTFDTKKASGELANMVQFAK